MYNICCIVNDKAYPLGVERILLAKPAIQTTTRHFFVAFMHSGSIHTKSACSP